MPISVTGPIERAWKRMVDTLFKPFEISKWFGLGFCFFLAYLGSGGGGGGGGNFNIPTGGGPSGQPSGWPPSSSPPGGPTTVPSSPGGFPSTTPGTGGGGVGGQQPVPGPWQVFDAVIQWIKTHPSYTIGIVLSFFVILTLIWALIYWLRSRGTFMMIDGLAYNRGLVKDPWRNYRDLGNSLFKFNFCVFLAVFVFTVLILVVAGFIAWPDIQSHEFGEYLIWAIIILVVVLPLTWVNFAIMEMLLVDFIAPTMYIHGLRVGPAWSLWYNEVFKGHFWIITLFYLMKMVLSIAAGVAAMIAYCLTCCCLTQIPYIGTVILLPILVFMRCYTLYFLEQFGEPWRLFVYDSDGILCVSCGYDLRGNPAALTCPECGSPTPMAEPGTGGEVV